MRRRRWSHYAAPAAFLLAVTIAVGLVRSALDSGRSTTAATTLPPAPTRTAPARTVKKPPKKPKAAAPRFYTVVAGDTFSVISSKTGVPVARIQALNPNADSNALFIGQRLRIR
jgi:LysM repeat protein